MALRPTPSTREASFKPTWQTLNRALFRLAFGNWPKSSKIAQIKADLLEAKHLFDDENDFDTALSLIIESKSDRPKNKNLVTRLKSALGRSTLKEFYDHKPLMVAFLILAKKQWGKN